MFGSQLVECLERIRRNSLVGGVTFVGGGVLLGVGFEVSEAHSFSLLSTTALATMPACHNAPVHDDHGLTSY